jgi:hypothetical protein
MVVRFCIASLARKTPAQQKIPTFSRLDREICRKWGSFPQVIHRLDIVNTAADGYPAPSPRAVGWKAMERAVDGFGRTSAENRPKGAPENAIVIRASWWPLYSYRALQPSDFQSHTGAAEYQGQPVTLRPAPRPARPGTRSAGAVCRAADYSLATEFSPRGRSALVRPP